MKTWFLIALTLFSLNSMAGEYISDCGSLQLETDRGGMTLEVSKVSPSFGKGEYSSKVFINNSYGAETKVTGLNLKLVTTRFIENYTSSAGVRYIVYSALFMITADETISRTTTGEGEVLSFKFKEVSLVCSDRFQP